jgi:hypothetical protein
MIEPGIFTYTFVKGIFCIKDSCSITPDPEGTDIDIFIQQGGNPSE